MTTLLELLTEGYGHMGRSDTTVKTMLTRGINAGLIATVILHEPPEARANSNLTAVAAGTAIDISSGLTRYLRVEEVYNSTQSQKVWPLNFHQLEAFPMPTGTGVLYYALYGDEMYYKPYPSSNETLKTHYLQYPTRLTDDGDTVPYDFYQDFVLGFASMFAFACIEEGESVQIWERIGQNLGIPFSILARVRGILREEAVNVRDVQDVMAEGTAVS